MAPNDSWLTRTTNAAAAGLGNFTGGIVNAVGNGVVGAGRGAGSSVTNTTRGWGDTVREYGNSIKDVTGASGARAGTNKNPLGLASSKGGAKATMASRSGGTQRKGTAGNPLGL
ncbi:uncharacterized protein BDR25DRAFT_346881 [Lindgomyces ingoldianus]|uniref:Uncharacterized protein n=1 Tax=Lindgomyces ingoldianus TaxID=673940 RepID=A0ACB6QAW1_9PLEO|nr:uncharacterized protein BDR25DRAFT_346881 [Lindgomyces ingoldianus]KAF2464064.1 hypothetical protein BDR25DRAFT_346881 [Lindgomyces ingoldianus]